MPGRPEGKAKAPLGSWGAERSANSPSERGHGGLERQAAALLQSISPETRFGAGHGPGIPAWESGRKGRSVLAC